MKKKILLCSIIMALMLVVVTGCGGSDEKEASGVKDGSSSYSITKANISEKVILDKDGIKVTAKSISYDELLGPEIKLLIENNSSKNVTIQTDNFSINGIMIDGIMSADVAAGKKANDSIAILNSYLETAQIKAIKDLEFDLDVLEASSYDTIFTQKDIKLTTDVKDYVQTYNTSGQLVVDQDNIKLYVLKLNDKDSFWGAEVYVYVENNSKQDVEISSDDVSINGFMVDPAFYVEVESGKKIYESISFLESDLKDNDIKDITELEISFKAHDSDYNTIFKTSSKKITFK